MQVDSSNVVHLGAATDTEEYQDVEDVVHLAGADPEAAQHQEIDYTDAETENVVHLAGGDPEAAQHQVIHTSIQVSRCHSD